MTCIQWTALARDAESQAGLATTESQMRSYARVGTEYSNAGRGAAVTGGTRQNKKAAPEVAKLRKPTKPSARSALGAVTARKQASFQ